MSNKISVIVPVYNTFEYLDKCVDSIVEQTYSNIEILLVDDGSTDGSGKKCDEWAKKDKRIKTYHKKNGGLSDARNYGIERATGTVLSFVDSDDWIEHNMYEVLLNEMTKNNADIMICGRYFEFGEKSIKWGASEKFLMGPKDAIIKLNSFSGFDMAAWDKLYKKNVFEDMCFPFGKKCEDAYIMYKLFDNAQKIEYYPGYFYHYFQRKNSIARSQSLNMDLIYAAIEQEQYIEKKYSNIAFVGETGLAFAVKSMFEIAINRDIKISGELRKYKKDVKKYGKSVMNNPFLPAKKKITFAIFNDLYVCYYVIKKMKNFITKIRMGGVV